MILNYSDPHKVDSVPYNKAYINTLSWVPGLTSLDFLQTTPFT